jgi:hypothetical protein
MEPFKWARCRDTQSAGITLPTSAKAAETCNLHIFEVNKIMRGLILPSEH